jgi:dienelactone hydrolase
VIYEHCTMKSITALALLLLAAFPAKGAEPLPGTKSLEWEEADLSKRMMDGAHQFIERKIDEAPEKRAAFWSRDFSSAEAYVKSVQPNRERLRKIIGAVDARLPAKMEHYGDDLWPALVAETSAYSVYQVRWPVLDGLWGSGLLVQPKGVTAARVVVVPDADQTPEQLLGLAPGIAPESQVARRLAENGCSVVVPVTISRSKLKTDDSQLSRSDQTHREWIYRQAFHMGRHVIGYEVQIVLAAVDWFAAQPGDSKIGVSGSVEGGLVAFHSAALDTRIDSVLVSGYFDSRQRVWVEPIYRNVWSRLREFGDAELAGLILPRTLVIGHSSVPDVRGHKGELWTPDLTGAQGEVARIETGPDFERPVLEQNPEQALAAFVRSLGVEKLAPVSSESPLDQRNHFDPGVRHQRLFTEMETHVQSLVRAAEHVRDQAYLFNVMPELANNKWSTESVHPTHSPGKFIEGSKAYRQAFWEEGMGKFDDPMLPFNARTRIVAENEKWTAYDVVLDVFPELFAWGLLVLPKDMQAGERRPVVVCQHGRDGVPRNLLDGNTSGYKNVAAVLAERGFITFAPHNLYRGEDRYRWLDRKANTVKTTLFSFIIAQHDQILRWLETQRFVDGKRIAFYGLSYGGETALRVPTILEKYALSICSGDFNQWTRKVAATDQPFSFMRTIEWEMPYWNLGHTFDCAEMTYLMLPRPFMVERGHHDLVGRDQWVAHEYAKVRWLYAQFGLADRTVIEYFQGGHSMRSEGAFDFLHQHLNWPKR